MKPGLVAAFFIVAVVIPSVAQMRGMRSGAPVRSFARPSPGFARPMGVRPAIGGTPAFRSFRQSTPFRARGFVTFGFSNHGSGFVRRPFFPRHHRVFFSTFPFGSPFIVGSVYPYLAEYPGVYGSDVSAYQQSYSDDSYDRVSSQLNQLSSQIESLRDENESWRSEMDRRKPITRGERSVVHDPPTVLFFRDGHRGETQSYAVGGQTFGILSESRPTKVPLSDLNLDQ